MYYTFSDWNPVVRGAYIEETVPIYIKTNSVVGSGDKMYLYFYAPLGPYSGFVVRFTDPPQYYIHFCMNWTDVPVSLPAEQEKVWKISKTLEPRIVVTCNGKEVLNLLMSDTTCNWSPIYWHLFYLVDVARMRFPTRGEAPNEDTASEYWSKGPCTC